MRQFSSFDQIGPLIWSSLINQTLLFKPPPPPTFSVTLFKPNQTKLRNQHQFQIMNNFVCGNFSDLDEEEEGSYRNPLSSSRKLRSRNSFCRRSQNKDASKNPYSKRGLDKFAALLNELDEKRRKIYSQMAEDDEPLVHFVYKNSDDSVPVPIVINLKDKKGDQKNKEKKKCNFIRSKEKKCSFTRQNSDANSEASTDKSSSLTGSPAREVGTPVSGQAVEPEKKGVQINQVLKTIELSSWWRRPSFYLPAVVILILLFLVFFSRSAAIMCTCIGWYVVPTLQGDSSNDRRPMKKKEYVRRLSDKNGKVSFKGQHFGNKSPPHAAAPVTGKGR